MALKVGDTLLSGIERYMVIALGINGSVFLSKYEDNNVYMKTWKSV